MKLEIQNTLSVLFLSMINLSLCVQDIAKETLNSLNNEFHRGKPFQSSHYRHENFLLIDYLADGEMERRISYEGVTAKETSIGNSSKSVSLWQLSNGSGFIQMIYSRDYQIIDCEYVDGKHFVNDFLKKFYKEYETTRSRNFSSPLNNHFKRSMTSSREFQLFNDNGVVPDDFYEQPEESDIVDAFGLRNLDYKILKHKADLPDDILPLINYENLKTQCDKRHNEMKRIVDDMDHDNEEMRRNANESLKRKKRTLTEYLVIPNTKWCGEGTTASDYGQLGGDSKTDKCCRRHDLCKINIPALTTKWHFFNYRPFTLSHCRCDKRFRTCLKMADSSESALVGKLFFNIIQTKCFIFKPEITCKKRSWWGKCEKKIVRKRAHMIDNRKF